MTEKVFDCLVAGSEPQGLWLLTQLSKRYSQCKADAALGWLALDEEPKPQPFPSTIASLFDLSPGVPCRMEIVSPKACVDWNEFTSHKDFPGPIPKTIKPGRAEMSALRFALRSNPDLLSLAGAVWRHVGKTGPLSPEMLLWGALLCSNNFWWHPFTSMPSKIKKLGSTPANSLKITRLAKTALLKVFTSAGEEFTTKHLVLAVTPKEFSKLSPSIRSILPSYEPYPLTDYCMTLEVGPSPHLKVCAPLVTYMDTDEIADLDTEMWSFQIFSGERSKIQAFVRAPGETSLEFLQEKFRETYKRLNRIIPSLMEHTQSIWPPLDTESCFTSENRVFVTETLKAQARELYGTTAWRTDTDVPGVFFLGANLNCFLPYPIGPMVLAKELVAKLLDKRRIKQAEKLMTAAGPQAR